MRWGDRQWISGQVRRRAGEGRAYNQRQARLTGLLAPMGHNLAPLQLLLFSGSHNQRFPRRKRESSGDAAGATCHPDAGDGDVRAESPGSECKCSHRVDAKSRPGRRRRSFGSQPVADPDGRRPDDVSGIGTPLKLRQDNLHLAKLN